MSAQVSGNPAPDAAEPDGADPASGRAASNASPPRWKRLVWKRIPDLVAIVILSFAIWAVADSVVNWWQTDSDAIFDPTTGRNWLGSSIDFQRDGNPLTFDFGDSPYTIERETFRGDAAAALDRLQDRCGELTQQSRWPSHPSTDAETELIGRIAELAPVAQDAEWKLYRLEYPTVMLVGIRTQSAAPPTTSVRRRVVCWGIVFPEAEDGWKLFVFYPADGDHDGDRLEIPLPADARRSMSIRTQSGGGLTAFRGSGTLAGWRKHFENWSETHEPADELTPSVPIRISEKSLTLRMKFQPGEQQEWIDIQLQELNNGELSGLIVISPVSKTTLAPPTP